MGSLVESGAAEGAHPSVTPSSGTGYTPAPAVMHSVQCYRSAFNVGGSNK